MAERTRKITKKRKRKDLIWTVLMFASIAVMVFSGYKLFGIYTEYKQGEDEYEEIAVLADELREKAFSKPVETEANVQTEAQTEGAGEETVPEETTAEETFDPAAYAQWFAELHAINPDIVGWISIDGTKINYPVMHGSTNDTYLYRTYQGTHNGAGSIFMETSNDTDFSDCHTILYGHNMKNGTMFAGLHKYADKNYYLAHPKILIETEAGPCWYEIFSCHTANAYDDLYDISFVPGEAFGNFASGLKNLSEYETGVNVTGEDRILTLSTCKGNGDTRFVVHAKLTAAP